MTPSVVGDLELQVDAMRDAVPDERNMGDSIHDVRRLIVQAGGTNSGFASGGIVDRDFVGAAAVRHSVSYAAAWPRGGNAGVEHQLATAADAQAEDRLDRHAEHPAGAAGVPGPAGAADVRRLAVDVGRHHVGLGLVHGDLLRRAGVVDRVEHVQQLDRSAAAADLGHARTNHRTPCVYCPPFSRMPGR